MCKAYKNVNVTYLRQIYFTYPYIIYCVEVCDKARDITPLIKNTKENLKEITKLETNFHYY